VISSDKINTANLLHSIQNHLLKENRGYSRKR
jgi:hypothetical protein